LVTIRQKNEFFPNLSKFSPNVLYTFIFKDTTVAHCEKKGKKKWKESASLFDFGK
jgi:hypothetical protein